MTKNFRSISGTRLPRPCSVCSSGRAEREFLDHFAEFHPHRVEGFLRDGFQTRVNVMAGFHRAVEQIDRVGQHFFELAAMRRCAHAQDVERTESTPSTSARPMRRISRRHAEQAEDEVTTATAMIRHKREDFRRAVLQIGLIDVELQAPQHADPGDEIAERSERAALLAAHQVARACACAPPGSAQFAQARWREHRSACCCGTLQT